MLTAGIDLSVGMVFVLDQLPGLVHRRRLAAAGGARRGRRARWPGALCGAINGVIVIYGRLQPIVTTIATGAIYYGIALRLRPVPGGDVQRRPRRCADRPAVRRRPGEPGGAARRRAGRLGALPPLGHRPRRLCHRLVGGRGLHVRRADRAAPSSAAYTLAGLLAALGGLLLTFITYSGEASVANGGTYTLYSIAAVVIGGVSLFGGAGSAIGAIFGALVLPHHRRPAVRVRPRPAVAAAVPGRRPARSRSASGSLRLLRVRNRLDLFG